MALQKTPMTPSPAKGSIPVSPQAKPPVGKKIPSPGMGSVPFWTGLAVSIGWVAVVLLIIAGSGPSHSLGGIPLVDWAIGISAAVSPVAMVWMITAYLQRAADIQTIADPLRRQLTLITGESGAADARIRRFNQAIREQIELLRSAQTVSQDDLEAVMDRVRQHRADLERFESASTHQVKEIQDVVRRSMFQLEQMMDDKFTMLRVLDGKLQQNGDGVARQVESVGENVARLLEEIEHTGAQVAESLERAQRDSQKLADTSHLQASSLTNAAEVAANTLGGLSSTIDLSVARFLERASTAREEAERLAHALDAQTRALDEFSTTLPVRVSEAESVLRGVADRLYASEQMAREQAVHLSDKLSQQVDGLQSFMDRFTGRLSDIDAGLDRRQVDLNNLAERIGTTTSGFVSSWEKSVTDLNDRTGNTLLRFTVVNDETRRNAESVAAHLSETTGKYEDVVTRMRALSADSSTQMKGMTAEVETHLAQFESLSKASNQAGQEVQERANIALQNLQHVLERILAAREATQTVGETLVKDIHAAVDQNEKMIQRLSETAQLGARAIGSATEQLGRQEGDLANKARDGEAVLVESVQKLQSQAEAATGSLREQTNVLTNLLAETQSHLIATDQKLQSFASQAVAPVQAAVKQIDSSADQGLRTLTSYNDGLTAQVNRLQDYNTRIGGMSAEMGKATSESASTLESLSSRFVAARSAQEEAVRQTLAQFSELSDRLQREVGALDGHAAQSVELLEQSARKVGEQSYQMLQNAQSSGAQIRDITVALQAEASQIQTLLHQQTETISGDLTRAEQKFTSIGETIRERADAAHALLDRTAAHYGEVSQKLDKVGTDAARIEGHAIEIAANSGRAVQNLSVLNDKMLSTHEAASGHAEKTLNKLDETTSLFHRRVTDMNDAAQVATDNVTKASAVFGEQTGKLIDGSHQIDAVLRQLTQATTALTDQAAHIRSGMEQQNNRLLSQLADSVAQLDVTGGKLQQVVSVAVGGADQASTRFSDMTETASKRIGATTHDLHNMAERAEFTLAALGANITQQAASLSVVGEQIGEQQRILAVSNEKQRAQMVELFDKLGAAHSQASEIAERSIGFLKESLQEIHRQMGMVGDQSQTAVGNVKMASMGFCDQANLLLQSAQAAEQQARTVLSVTSALQEQARHLRESLQSEGERAEESLGALLGRLTAGGMEVREIGSSTNTVLTTLQRAMGEQAAELSGSMQQISDRQRNLTASLDQQRESINGLLNRLTLAQDETASVAERASIRLVDGTQQITRHVEILDARTQSALVSVQAASTGFAHESEAIETQARQAEQQTRALLSAATGIHEQVQDLRGSMQTEGERTNSMLSSLLDKVTTGAADLRDMSAATEMSLISLGNNVSQQSSTLTSAMQQISDRQRSLAVSLDAQRDVVNGLLNRLTLAQDETASVADRTVTRLTDGAQSIIRQAETIDARTQAALASVHAATEAFNKEAEAIDVQAKQAEIQAQAILASASGLHSQIYDLRTSMQNDGERATEVLSGLFTRVTAGSGEVREASASAEVILSTLQNTLSEQTSELYTSMHQVSERQKMLTASLEGQRESINSLLNRYTLAQDETASVAERTSERISEGAQKIANSIDLIGAQASTTLATVQESVVGFTEQVSALSVQSQQAEQQVRGVLSVTAGMQEQARHLREAMQVETARVVEQLSSVIAQLDLTSNHLKTESGAAMHTIDQTAQRFAAVTETGADLIRKQSETLSQTADQSEARMNNAGEKVRSHLRLVGEIGDKAESQARQLADAAEFATTRMATLRDTLDVNDKQSRDVVGAATQRIEDVKAALQAQLQHLSEFSQKTVEQVTGATDNLALQSEALRANLAISETALTEAAEMVREESKHLPVTLNRGVSDIEAVTRALKGQVADADQTLIGTADRFITVTAAARNNMIEEMQHVSKVADEAGKVLNGFNEMLANQVAAMQQNTVLLSAEQKDLVEKASLSVGALTEAGNRLSLLRGEASVTAERLSHEFTALDQRVTATSGRLVQAGDGLAKQVEAINDAATRAESQMSTVSDTLREQLERIRAGLQTQIDDINRGLMQITAQLERTGATLRSTTVGAVADVERVGQRFDQTGGEAAAQVEARTQQMRAATEEVSKLLSGFGSQFDVMLSHMAQAGNGIKRQEGDMFTNLQTMLAHLSTVAEKLEAARTMSGSVSQHAVERLGEVVTAVGAQMNNMTAGAQTAAGIMRGIGQIYSDQTTALTRGVGEAHNQVLTMNQSIDEMQERTDRMRSSLKLQGDEMMNSLRQILAQLEMTGDGLSEAVDRTLQEQANSGLKKIS
jgi:hypothetical protein